MINNFLLKRSHRANAYFKNGYLNSGGYKKAIKNLSLKKYLVQLKEEALRLRAQVYLVSVI